MTLFQSPYLSNRQTAEGGDRRSEGGEKREGRSKPKKVTSNPEQPESILLHTFLGGKQGMMARKRNASPEKKETDNNTGTIKKRTTINSQRRLHEARRTHVRRRGEYNWKLPTIALRTMFLHRERKRSCTVPQKGKEQEVTTGGRRGGGQNRSTQSKLTTAVKTGPKRKKGQTKKSEEAEVY